jgi:hypothetical protein
MALPATAGHHGGGRCQSLAGLQLRLLVVSTVFYALQVAVAAFALALAATEAELPESLGATVPLTSPRAVFTRNGMLLAFWVVPFIVVLLTTDGHAAALVAVACQRLLRRARRRWPWLLKHRARGGAAGAAAAGAAVVDAGEERGRRYASVRSLSGPVSGRSVEGQGADL